MSFRPLPRMTTRRERSEAGASVVEAVLVTPLFLLLIFGIIELGAAFMNWNAIHGAAREGAHVGSVYGASPESDYMILQDVKGRLRASIAGVKYVIVFRAKTTTDDPPAECLQAAALGNSGFAELPDPIDPLAYKIRCNIYYVADFNRPKSAFGALVNPADAYWPATERTDWSDGPPDFVGVHIATTHKTLTGILPSGTLHYTTVFSIEPTTGEGK
jgi:hypothetical protein